MAYLYQAYIRDLSYEFSVGDSLVGEYSYTNLEDCIKDIRDCLDFLYEDNVDIFNFYAGEDSNCYYIKDQNYPRDCVGIIVPKTEPLSANG